MIFSCFTFMVVIQGLILLIQGLYCLLFDFLHCLEHASLMSLSSVRFFEVEGHGIQEELHVPLVETKVAHAGKPVMFL